ncbi:MAG: ClbS/DfsB family four-helix bundle protein [Candidatus Heimdallarchaeota archaeon]|nr:ClbS/DfsB family four-helix bundle protein [Candidatus Heimdallarchaeota archaeon]MBY8993629.1 ClbS/DfsB family four-helix bundle protein [Candidatus Heimdallarchaeota archaeon]
MKKKTLLKKIRYRRKHWDSTVEAIVKKGLEKERISDKWFVKDSIAHITWYEKELLDALEKKSIVESEFWNMSVKDRNEMIFNKTQEKSFDEILEDSRSTFDALLVKIESLSNEELCSDVYIRRKSDTRVTWDFIGGITFWHYEDHEDLFIELFDLDYGL